VQPLSSASDSFTLAYYTEDGRLKIDDNGAEQQPRSNRVRVGDRSRPLMSFIAPVAAFFAQI
jgi:hypothetical protein